ncbi:LytR C-terminal domain-containing protein [Gryllotalpicola reticulitermitis]|uniref:LytR C-terminal domain-containing protein n=1 Tax=Gryllotalpicola reticulitermitis TaxID=1184153 RepID=A0ABV8Q2T9_9MICO
MPQQYPRDRFDLIPAELQRVGAHRTPKKRLRGSPWIISCAVAIVVIIAAGWIYLRVLDHRVFGGTNGVNPAATGTPNPTGSPTPSATATSTPTATPTPTPTPTMVPTAPLAVLNGSRRAGLAAGAKTKLLAAGWNSIVTGNAPQSGIATSTVYYADPSLRGIALGVAQALGIGSVTQAALPSNAANVQVAVVLGSDYQG